MFIRKVLVAFQFVISIFLISVSGFFIFQLNFLKTHDPGFQKEHIIALDLDDPGISQQKNSFIDEILQIPGVSMYSSTNNYPGSGNLNMDMYYLGENKEDQHMLVSVECDRNFFKLLEIETKHSSDPLLLNYMDSTCYIINETAAKLTGVENPVGLEISDVGIKGERESTKGTIMGVVKDFHLKSFKFNIQPIAMRFSDQASSVLIKYKGITKNEMSNSLKQVYEKFSDLPFMPSHIDDSFWNYYDAEKRLSKLFLYFTCIAIIIACLGLFGLAAYSTEQRTKEIGIRKVMGAPVSKILRLFIVDYNKLFLISMAIAWIGAYFFLNSWLNNFAYKVNLLHALWIFPSSTSIILLLASTTIGGKVLGTAQKNPAESLRYE